MPSRPRKIAGSARPGRKPKKKGGKPSPAAAPAAAAPPTDAAAQRGQPRSGAPFPIVGMALTARCYRIWLACIVTFALAFRVGYVLIFTRFQNQRIYDALWYQLTAEQFRLGQFFRVPTRRVFQ